MTQRGLSPQTFSIENVPPTAFPTNPQSTRKPEGISPETGAPPATQRSASLLHSKRDRVVPALRHRLAADAIVRSGRQAVRAHVETNINPGPRLSGREGFASLLRQILPQLDREGVPQQLFVLSIIANRICPRANRPVVVPSHCEGGPVPVGECVVAHRFTSRRSAPMGFGKRIRLLQKYRCKQ